MKPVEIEFLMKDSITAGLDKSKMSVEQLLGAARRASIAISGEINQQRKVIDGVNADLSKMEGKLHTMKPGPGQKELTAEIAACKKVLAEEVGVLNELEKQHRQAQQGVSQLEEEYRKMAISEEQASLQNKSLSDKIAEQRAVVKQVESDVRALQKAYENAAPGKAQSEALAELNAAKKALQEDKAILASLTEEQEKNANSTKRLTSQLKEMQNAMAQMRLNGEQNTEEYRRMAEEAAKLADTIGDLRTQTNILANDNANLQGFISGINGISGAFTAATGVMSLFASENENLMKIQARVQSVMAITMGLQQAFNALNKDSAFRLVTVTKAKDMLTAANTRLAAALGISTVTAQALMATLTLGLSVVITGVIVAWNKFSEAQEEAAKKAQEMVEIEADGRAQMIKTRFELNNTIREIKEFNGTKEEEKAKVEELNKKYGETFGYCDTLAQWYDTLIEKSEQYINMLFLQAKAQSMVNKAVEKDEELNKLKAQSPDDADTSMGWFSKWGLYMAQSESRGAIDAQKMIHDYNKTEYDKAVAALEKERQDLLDEAEALMAEAASVGKGANIGGHRSPSTTPTKNTTPKNNRKDENDKRLKAEQEAAKELQRMRLQNEQDEINLMKEGSEKRTRQIQLDYDKEIAEIKEQEQKWREAQNGKLNAEQSEVLLQAYKNAQDKMNQSLQEMSDEEIAKNKEKLNALLDQYKDFDQKRRSIDEQYNADMQVLNSELDRLRAAGSDTSDIEASIAARTEAYKREIASLQSEILKSSEFYDKLFGEVSEKGYKVLKDFYSQAKETLSKARVLTDGVEIDIPVKDPDGKFVKKTVKVTVDEFRRMQKQVDSIKKELEKNNPFAAFRSSWSSLIKEMKNDGDVSGALKKVNADGKALTGTIKGWGESLESVFGERFSKSINEMMSFCDGMMDMGTGIAQIWSGDIVGGITNALSGLGQIISLFTSWKEKMEEMKRQWYIAEIETNRAIRERSQELAVNRDTIADIIKDQEILNWLVQKGYSRPNSVSVWEAQNEAFQKYQQNIKAEMQANDDLWGRLQGSNGYYEWGNSLNGGSAEWSLRGYSAEQIQLWYNQDKLSDAARDYYEAWVESGKTIDDLKSKIEECYTQMREMVMGVNFDGFLSNVKDALKEARGDIKSFAQFTEDTIAEALLNAFMYQELANMIEPLYNELSESLINGTADETYLDNWKNRFQDVMSNANSRLDEIAKATGIDVFSGSGSSQSGKAGGFSAMSQEQGTKLEGLFVSGQMHWSNIDEHTEDISVKMSTVSDKLARIEEHTGESKKLLDGIKSSVEKIIREGLKVK